MVSLTLYHHHYSLLRPFVTLLPADKWHSVQPMLYGCSIHFVNCLFSMH